MIKLFNKQAMKKQLITIIAVLISQMAFSQTTNENPCPQWLGDCSDQSPIYRTGMVVIGSEMPLGNLTVGGTNPSIVLATGDTQLKLSTELSEAIFQLDGGNAMTFDMGSGDHIQFGNATIPSIMTITADGKIGIKNSNPSFDLDIEESINAKRYYLDGKLLDLERLGLWTEGNNGIYYDNGGGVGIGTIPVPGYALAVEGRIGTREVKVTPQSWPDYVFAKEYDLMPLADLQSFIQKHRHLPNIPSEKEVNENGIDAGAMNALLLEKIEELTLYLIELEGEIKELENRK